MTRRLSAILALLVCAGAFAAVRVDAAPACDVTWDGPAAGGTWGTPANWDTDTLPGPADHACIPATASVLHSSGTTQVLTVQVDGTLRVTAGTLETTSTADDSEVAALELAGGTLLGAGDVLIGATMEWTGGSMSGAGTTSVLPGATLDKGGFTSLAEGRTLAIGGLMEVTADQPIIDGGGADPLVGVLAGGIVRKTAGAGVSRIDTPVRNDGTIESAAGTLNLDGGGAPAAPSTGTYGGGAGTGTVQFAGGTHLLGAGSELAGRTLLSSGVVAPDGAATTTVSGAGNRITGGSVAGTGTLAVAGGLAWDGGAMTAAGTTRVLAGATLAHGGFTSLAEGRLLEIAGLMTMDAAQPIIDGGGVDPLVHVDDGGTIRRATTTGTARIDAPVENDGTVAATTGLLRIDGGGGAGTADGTFGAAAATGTVEFGGGTFTLADGAVLAGGTHLISGTVAVAGGATATASGANEVSGGVVGGTGTLAVTGTLVWDGGTMTAAGITRVPAGGTLVHAGFTSLADGRTLEIGGLLRMDADQPIVDGGGADPALRVLGTGTVRKAAGAGTARIDVPFRNDGAVESAAGTLNLDGGGGVTPAGGTFGDAGAAGTVQFGGGTFPLADGAELAGGTVLTSGSVQVVEDATATATDTNRVAGGIVGGAGQLEIAGILRWSGGTMGDAGVTRVLTGGELLHEGFTALAGGRTLEVAGLLRSDVDQPIVDGGGDDPFVHVPAGGTVRKAAGTGTTRIDPPLRNDGALRASTGTLSLAGGGGPDPAAGSFGVAGAGGTVRFGTGTFLLSGATLGGGVALEGGALEVPAGASATTSGDNRMTGGVVRGAGTVLVGGTLHWTGGVMADAGTTEVVAGGILAHEGFTQLQTGRVIEVGGLLDVRGDHTMIGSSLPRPQIHVLSVGTLRKSAGTGTASLGPALRNDGDVESTAGALSLSGDDTSVHTGTFTGASETALPVFGQGEHVLDGSADLDGWTRISQGTVAVGAGETVTVDDNLVHAGGTLAGPGTLSVTGLLRWTGGAQSGPGTTLVQPAGELEVAAGDFGCFVSLESGRLLDNRGTMTVLRGSGIDTSDDPRPTIENSGTLRFAEATPASCASVHSISGTGPLHNTGTIEKLGGDGVATIGDVLDNDGEIVVTQGELRLESSSAVTQTGAFRGTGGPVTFAFGDFDIGPGASIGGDVTVESAELQLPDGLVLTVEAGDTLRMTNGGAIAGGDLRVLGAFAWADGRRTGAGTTVVEPGGTLTVGTDDPNDPGFSQLVGHALVNRGAAELRQEGFLSVGDGASITNAGTFTVAGGELSGDAGFGSGFGSLLHNTGTLRKTGADFVRVSAALDNDGVVEVTGGTVQFVGLLNWSADGFGSEGALTGGDFLIRDGAGMWLPGPMRTNAARLVLDGPGARVQYQNPSQPGSIINALAGLDRNAAGGRLELLGGHQLGITGTLRNAGVLRVGAGSTLTATDGYVQEGANAVLRTVLVSPSSHGRVETPGPATLGGRLDAEKGAGFAPVSGQEFGVLSAGSVTGTFAEVSGRDAGGGLVLDPRYTATGVTLAVQPPGGLAQAPGDGGAAAAKPAAPAAPAAAKPTTLDDRALRILAGPWSRTRLGGTTVTVATRRAASLGRSRISFRDLALLARTCRRCGSVDVYFRGRLLKRVSLRSRRQGRRLIPIVAFASARTGALRLRTTSARRVAIDGLVLDRRR